jgi:uncharacterized protein (DUF885 family)
MKHKKLLGIVCAISVALLASCNQQESATNEQQPIEKTQLVEQKDAESTQKALLKNFDKANQILFKNRAIAATLFGVSEDSAGYHFQSAMEDYTPQSEAKFRQNLAEISSSLNQLITDSKEDEDNRKVVADIVDYFAGAKEMPVGFIDAWMGHSAFIVNQINGPLIDIPNNLINSHTISSVADANDYLHRLSKFATTLDSINQKLITDAAQGWIPPKVIVEKSINYLKGFVQVSLDETSLVASFTAKLDKLKNLSDQEKTKMQARAKQLMSQGVYTGYKKITESMQNLLVKATSESGIWAQPKGAEFYRYSVGKLGDTDLTPDDIHKIGLVEVARISAEMDSILTSQGYKEGSVGERMIALNGEARFLYSNTDEGRAELLAFLNVTIDQISKIMPSQFKSVPPYPVEVKRIPVATQNSSAGGYYTPPSINGDVPGIYWINLRDTKANPKFDLKTLTFHEAVPGHHWQIALNLAQEQLPLLRRIAPYNAYMEGWALYSEQVAYEMGLYKDDPFGNLGRLKAELFRAVRLVVDTGMHAKKWSREKAIDYMASTTGTEKSDVVSEIERYMVWPGQALGYKLGMLKILSLREYAKNKLGIAFNIKEFHDVVLLSGAVPMKVLDENVKAWVETYL